jgi:hypothetical protein
MTNGFYNTSNLNTKAKKKAFILDVIQLSYNVVIQVKYKGKSITREVEKESSIKDFIKILLAKGEINCIDREMYSRGEIPNQDGEISIVWTGDKNTPYWRLLYCFMNLNNFKKLVKKYNLKLKEWEWK